MGRSRIEAIRPFLARVVEKLHPERVMLFGSRARGQWNRHSDYDLLVVARRFSGMHSLDRMLAVRNLIHNDVFSLDVVCLTPKEFMAARDDPSSGVVYTAAHEGVEVAVATRKSRFAA